MSKSQANIARYFGIALAACIVLYFGGFVLLMLDHYFFGYWIITHCPDWVSRVTIVIYGPLIGLWNRYMP